MRLPLLRTSIIAAVAGHWAATLLLDRDEYVGASMAVRGRIFQPMVAQTLVAIALVAVITAFRRGRIGDHVARQWTQWRLLAWFGAIQLVPFVLTEVAERLWVGPNAAAHVGLVDRTFIMEMLLALVVAVALTLIALAAMAVVRALSSAPSLRSSAPLRMRPIVDGFRPPRGSLEAGWSTRAPPLSA